MIITKKRGRPKGSKNKTKEKKIELTVEKQIEPIVKKRGRPTGSKNKSKANIKEFTQEIESTIVEQLPIIKKLGRPTGSRNKFSTGIPIQKIPTQEIQGTPNLKLAWEYLNTGYKNYINLKNNLELHKEDIPIFANDYRNRYKRNPRYVVLNLRNAHLVPYIQEEFPDIGVGYLGGISLWELHFCFG